MKALITIFLFFMALQAGPLWSGYTLWEYDLTSPQYWDGEYVTDCPSCDGSSNSNIKESYYGNSSQWDVRGNHREIPATDTGQETGIRFGSQVQEFTP